MWREGGNEVESDEFSSGAWNVHLSETWTSSQLTITNFSLLQHGQYTCQCENYEYTVEEINVVLKASRAFKYYCSDLQSIAVGSNGKHKQWHSRYNVTNFMLR